MKKFILFLLLAGLNLFLYAQSPCPPEGNATHEKEKQLNRWKNRPVDLKPGAELIPIETFLAPGNDTARFSPDQYVMVTGYVIHYSPGGSESCNCNSEDKKQHDIHIYIGRSPKAKKKDCLIVEITPPFKAANPVDLKKLKGKKVVVTGYLMFDFEHKGNARNTCKKCTRVWRRTAWEIHPVVQIVPAAP